MRVILHTLLAALVAAIPSAQLCARTFTRLLRSAPAADWPPPCPAPPHLVARFERGSMPITRDFCLAERREGGAAKTVWTEADIEKERAAVAADRSIGSYTVEHVKQLRAALRAHADVLDGRARAVVIGTTRPWIEAMLLDAGAASVLTFEYGEIESAHPRVAARACRDIAADYLEGAFEPVDVVVSYSSIEHSGLGRYGDALDPDGDVEAMKQAWCMLRPGGLAFIGLPMSCENSGNIEFNAHRIYGNKRLAMIARGFEFVGFDEQGCQSYLPSREPQPVIILRKPASGEYHNKSIRGEIERYIEAAQDAEL